MPSPVSVGIIGCGKISDAYFSGLKPYPWVRVTACADLDLGRAQAKGAQQGVRGCSVDDLLADPNVAIVVNLTVPQAHAPLNRRIIDAGKHPYTEKPFALTAAEGAEVLAHADRAGRLVGSAPDTFLGAGLQTARRAIDEGLIGRPVAAFAFMLCRGHESWHPSPAFYYEKGGGPMLDMGPYYLTALVNLLGPAARVSGSARASFPERTITSQPLAGTRIPVEVPTHYSTTVDFACGCTATLAMSFDVHGGPPMPRIAVFGTDGTLEVPDPNTFEGDVRLFRPGSQGPETVPHRHAAARLRGTGVADMALSLLSPGRPFRATGRLAQHVLEIMESAAVSSDLGRHLPLSSTCERPAPIPADLPANTLDA